MTGSRIERGRFHREVARMVLLAGVLPAAMAGLIHQVAGGAVWRLDELHRIVELLGGFTAMVVTGLMLSRHAQPRPMTLWCGCGLLMMGTLDVLHALSTPGGGFNWLRSLANLSGGLMFALIWLPEEISRRAARLAPPLAMITAALLGSLVFLSRGWLPASTSNGFSLSILAVNGIGGLLFLAAAAGLVLRAPAQDQDRLTLCGCWLLFGVAAVGFGATRAWHTDWWLLHLLRALAYVILGAYFIRQYRRTSEELADSLGQLRAERRRFQEVLDMLPAYVILLTPDYHVAFSNRLFRERFGESHGQRCFEFLFQRDSPCEVCETFKVLERGTPLQWKWTGPDGRHYDVSDFPFADADGSRLILEMGVDVTERHRAEQALQESEQRYRSLVVATSQIVWTTNPSGEVVTDMPMWRAFTGTSAAEVQGRGWLASLHPEDRERTAQIWSEAVKDRRLYETEYRIRRRDGEYRDVWVRGVPVLGADEEIREWVGTCTDITERKQAEQELRRLNRALRALSRCTEAVARATDEQELLRTVCEIVVQEGGYPLAWVGYAEQDEDKTVRPVAVAGLGADYVRNARITWADTERGRGPTGTSIRSGAPCYIPEITQDPRFNPWRQAALQHGYASVLAIPLREWSRSLGALNIYAPEPRAFEGEEYALMLELAETLAHGIVALRAQQERDRAAAELKELNTTLESRVEQRTAELAATTEEMESFTYSVSHDLRAPLRHIDGFSKVLLEQCSGQLDDLGRHYLERVRDGTQRMGQLVDDLLNLSRLGRRELQLRPLALGRMVEEVIEDLQPEAAGRRVEWHVGGLPAVQCDPGLMRQVLLNLLSNALKFTRGREPAIIEVGVEGGELFVRDNGVGFDPQYAGKLFGVFQRLHRSEEFAGTGVGLATVRRILRKHGGDIRAEAKPDAGATFYFTVGPPGSAMPAPAREESHAA